MDLAIRVVLRRYNPSPTFTAFFHHCLLLAVPASPSAEKDLHYLSCQYWNLLIPSLGSIPLARRTLLILQRLCLL
ncbi:hypothetical protein AG0111_0g4659 [Alternaria gaisen]|uniref:Uncharacterized protein n=1 Tax=Alternaria gaisen TaxID=167740 RepID=A0ACB6FTI8_9PLEO|nr:hypothetical protein AG0111_0g4659 [Alternaria gaisen]